MSDYMFMLENHLNAGQAKCLARLQASCDATGVNVFLAGGAMRDMLGGFPIRDLDFVVETNGIKLAKELAPDLDATIALHPTMAEELVTMRDPIRRHRRAAAE